MNDILRDMQAHYFGIPTTSGNTTTVTYYLGGVIKELPENSNPIESEKHYIHQKSATTNVTGYNNEFPITMDMVQGDEVFDDFYQLFYTRATGTDLKRDHIIVNLWEPVDGQTNTYKARKINQTVEIKEATGDAGAQMEITGSLKGGDFVYGTFNTSTKTFTENA